MTRPGRYGCAECSKSRRGVSFTKQVVKRVGSLAETMPNLAKEWHPIKNGTLSPSDISSGHFKTVWWLCPQCGYEWKASPSNRKKGSGCPCCSGRVPKSGVNDLATLHPELLKEWDYQKNTNLDPSQLLPGSGKKHGGNVPDVDMNGKLLLPTVQKDTVVPSAPNEETNLNKSLTLIRTIWQV